MTKRLTIYMLASFFLNYFWETWHAAYLYQGWDMKAKGYVIPLADAAIIDALMLTGILLIGMLIWKKKDWFLKMSRSKYVYFIVTALTVAIIVEIKGVYWLHKWQYSEMMPAIFGIGLSPLVQLVATGLLALWLARSVK